MSTVTNALDTIANEVSADPRFTLGEQRNIAMHIRGIAKKAALIESRDAQVEVGDGEES
jgi:hypothetical protein